MILILIFSVLLTEDLVEGQEVTLERFRGERLQGQCSAWCYETYGTLAPAVTVDSDSESVNVLQCGEDQECWDCHVGCEGEFQNRAQCYEKCDNKAPCEAACRQHEMLNRQDTDIAQLSRNLTRQIPLGIYEDSSERNESSVTIWWKKLKLFPDEVSVVYLVFLENQTADSSTFLGHTPHFKFTADQLSSDFCYRFRILTVNKDGVVGTGQSRSIFTTDIPIHITNINSTSADIGFRTRTCDGSIIHSVNLIWNNRGFTNFTRVPVNATNNGIVIANLTNLLPNMPYRVMVERLLSANGRPMFSFYGGFRTLPTLPDCENDHEKCSRWALSGYCSHKDYKDFMATSCQFSCNSCQSDEDEDDVEEPFPVLIPARKVSQSSVLKINNKKLKAQLAIDGDDSTKSQTVCKEDDAWFRYEFDGARKVSVVEIDIGNSDPRRQKLNGAMVFAEEEDGLKKICGKMRVRVSESKADQTYIVNCSKTTATAIEIVQNKAYNKKKCLELKEVRVYGLPEQAYTTEQSTTEAYTTEQA